MIERMHRAARALLVVTLAVGIGSGTAVAADITTERGGSGSGTVRLMAVGDLMLGRSIGRRIVEKGIDPFRHVRSELDTADVVVGNLECVISDRGRAQDKAFTFRAPIESAAALADAVDVVSSANNHGADYGRTGIVDTIDHLAAAGVVDVGAGRDAREAYAPEVLEINGLRLAFLGYAWRFSESTGWDIREFEATASRSGLALARRARMTADIAAARQVADVVIVQFHAGTEFVYEPSDRQKRIVGWALDGGADVVLGTHPHILQRGQPGDGTFVAWSLGNFVFDGYADYPRTRESVILELTLDASGVVAHRWVPVMLEGGLPRYAEGEDAARILRRVGG